METAPQLIPPEIEAAVAMKHGGPVAVSGQHSDHVVMTMAVFRDMMGVGNEEDFEKSVAAIKESLLQAAAGRTISLQEASEKLTQKYGI